MRWSVAAAFALAACAMAPGRETDDAFTAEGMANVGSLTCSERQVARLGYNVMRAGGETPEEGTIRGERRFDDDGVAPTRGYLTVSVARESDGPRLYVRAERYQESTSYPVPTNLPPRGTPQPAPFPSARRTGTRRVAPGVVAQHAREVVRACSFAAAREAQAR